MQLSEYQRLTKETAIYPASASVFYPVLGLAGEAGEIANKVKKIIRGDTPLDTDKKSELAKEIGDCLWYCAALASDLGFSLRDIYLDNARTSWPYDLYDLSLQLVSHTGVLAEMISTRCHVMDNPNATRNKEYCADVIGCVLYVLKRMCTLTNTTLERVCQANIDKLLSRKERGTLQGSGDNR